MKKFVLFVVSSLMVLSLVIASCDSSSDTGGSVTEEDESQIVTTGGDEVKETEDTEEITVSSDEPIYGGTTTLSLSTEPTFDLYGMGAAVPQIHAHQRLIDGDWAKGIAGGYGEGETTWGASTWIQDLNTGYIAENYSFEISDDSTEVVCTYTIRDNVHFALTDSTASKLVGGRKVTVDDVVWNWNQRIQNPEAMYHTFFPQMHYVEAVKINSDQMQVTYKFDDYMSSLMRENNVSLVFPPELYDTYGYEACTDWQYSVGTGAYTIDDYVPGNMILLKKNQNYWMKDPVGPGKGNVLPYMDKVKYIIMQDASTRQAALRTATIDQMKGFVPEEKDLMLKNSPDLEVAPRGSWQEQNLYMRTDLPPFDDVNVRKAMMMAIDFNEINDGLYEGIGDIISWPYWHVEGYDLLFFSPDSPDLPEEARELYTHDLDKAKQLLAKAGYPEGFKTTLVLTQTDIDYCAIISDYLSKIGIEIEFQVVESGARISIASSVSYDGLIALLSGPPSGFPGQAQYTASNWNNPSLINDPYIIEKAKEITGLAAIDFTGAMTECRELVKYMLPYAYVIPSPRHPTYTMWWPWLKNYNGETDLGFFAGDAWVQFIWLDQELKETMGH